MSQVRIRENGTIVIVDILAPKILDEEMIAEIGRDFSKLPLESAAGRKLLVNFRYVKFMSSSMIGHVVRLHKSCKADKIDLKLCGIGPEILEVFKITNLTKLLSIYDDEEKALNAYEKRGFFGR